ncbi:MAG: TIR domain-containing protein [Actinomycetota bacterium]
MELSDVFNEAKIPTVTYVEPKEGAPLRGSLLTEGKHVTLVGPSGSGKTTLAERSLQELGIGADKVLLMSGRTHSVASSILEVFGQQFAEPAELGAVTPFLAMYDFILIDDVHHLGTLARQELAQLLKLWHERDVRFFLIGIAKTSEELVGSDPELAIRNDVHQLGTQDREFCSRVVELGESALNFEFEDDSRNRVIEASRGIPSVLQATCRIACIDADVVRTVEDKTVVSVDLPRLRDTIVKMYDPRFFDRVVAVAKGKRQATSVHDTYLDIVTELAQSAESEVSREGLYHAIVGRIGDPAEKNRKSTSFYNCISNLPDVIADAGLSDALLYDPTSATLSIDDPAFRFYLDHLALERVRQRINIRTSGFEYDVAVSFAGEDRPTVLGLVQALQDRGVLVFYDFDQQAMLWGKDLRVVLADVYANRARYMLICLSSNYPERDWPTFEFEVGKDAADRRTEEYLLPVALAEDIPHLVGLPVTVAYLNLAELTIEQLADALVDKLTRPENP